jgi:lysophospholipase L1-like esterase
MTYQRFIALGDSFTEGMTDEIVAGNFRGWADRVADVLATQSSNFTYANLAIRGKLLKEVFEIQVPNAVEMITGKETLVSFHAGANDVLRPGYRIENVIPLYNEAVRKLAATGATLMLFTVLERTGNTGRTAEMWATRFSNFNENVRKISMEVGAVIVDANEKEFLSDRRLLAADRLHLSPLGHDRVAQGVLEVLKLPFDPNWRLPLPPATPTPWLVEKSKSVIWLVTFVAPWMWRRIRGKSSGDGRTAKYPIPINWPPF